MLSCAYLREKRVQFPFRPIIMRGNLLSWWEGGWEEEKPLEVPIIF